ncbi:hypothetical protein V8C42DRAFT_328365 [Trichoderma barbatum]
MLQTTVLADDGIGIVADVQRDSFHELETGQTFEILVDTEDAIKMKSALDLQWAVVRLSAMSGAAGVWERGDSLDDDEGGGVSLADTSERVTGKDVVLSKDVVPSKDVNDCVNDCHRG